MAEFKRSEMVRSVQEAHFGDMIVAGPWKAELADILIGCLLRNTPGQRFVERRKVQTAETLIFMPTDISMSLSLLKFSIAVSYDTPKGFFGRRKKTYWIFGRQDRHGEYYPISRHASIGEAVQMMTAYVGDILAAQGKGIV